MIATPHVHDGDSISAPHGFSFTVFDYSISIQTLCANSMCACIVILSFLLYLYVVATFRYKRVESLAARYGYGSRESFAQMTVHDAQKIQAEYAELESPQMFFSMSRLGLLKVFGIETISKTVLPQLPNEMSSSFRAVSTSIIMSEIICNPPSSDRVLDGIARMNYLHASYRRAGKITVPDMLYILSRFSVEPVRWAAAHDWRPMTDLEKCAVGVFWRDLGEKMEIPFTLLPSSATGWKDGLHWLEELDQWSSDYELSTMAPSEANKKAAAMATHIASFPVPTAPMRGFAKRSMAALLQPHQRDAMDLPTPTWLHTVVVFTVLWLRKTAYRWLLLPRPNAFRKHRVQQSPNAHGRYHDTSYNAYPWYIKPSLSWKLSPVSLFTWAVGGALPGSEAFEPRGYCIAELGPTRKVGKGIEEMKTDKERIKKMMIEIEKKGKGKGNGCPMF